MSWGEIGGIAANAFTGGTYGNYMNAYDPQYNQLSTLTSEQQLLLQNLLGQYYDAEGNFQMPGATNIIGGSQVQNTLNQMLSGNPESFEDYYTNAVYNPAMEEYENVTRPGFIESLGGLHSSSRDNLEMTSRQNLASQLSSTRASLAKTAQEQANEMQLAGLQTNLGYQQAQLGESQIPMQQMLALLGMPALENIVTQPSAMTGFLQSAFS